MQLFELSGKQIKVVVSDDLSLTVLSRDGRRLWESSRSLTPVGVVRCGEEAPRSAPLSASGAASVSAFDDGTYRGHAVLLSGVGGADVIVEVALGIDARADELMIQVAQSGGNDTLVAVEHFYRFEKPVADGGAMILPRGSGYLIPADCPDELPGEGRRRFESDHEYLVGDCWTLPLFGMVRGNDALCAIVETWWDCKVEGEHIPGDRSLLDFNWQPSLGKLAYPRRLLLRFDEGMDHVAMAKLYRSHARKQGILRTLEEKVAKTPTIRRYIENILFRWPAWNPNDGDAVLGDIRRLRDMGFGISFFFPKWGALSSATGQGDPPRGDAKWQAWLHPDPVPSGWPTLTKLLDSAHDLGCPVQGMIRMTSQTAGGVGYDEERWPVDAKGQRVTTSLSMSDDLDRVKRVLDQTEANGMKVDVLYFDGYSAHGPLPEDFSPSHPVTRRGMYEMQNACFAEVRRRGLMPSAELARFWCMADCDYFFYTDWSTDRMGNGPTLEATAPIGEPIPLFQLIFHDCYMAGFSGGGYALYLEGVDWWPDCTPRLYELLFTAAPAHNWLPDGYVPVRDWESEKTQRRWTWLKRWGAYYRAVATSEMVSHRFLSPDRKTQRIEFANGVVAEFNMATNEFRVKGVAGFSGDWERPEEL